MKLFLYGLGRVHISKLRNRCFGNGCFATIFKVYEVGGFLITLYQTKIELRVNKYQVTKSEVVDLLYRHDINHWFHL